MGKLTSAVIQDYNEYLKTHNSVEAGTKFNVNVNDTIVPISTEMFLNMLLNKIAMTQVFGANFDNPLASLISGEIYQGEYVENITTIVGTKENDYNVKDFETDVTNPWQKNKPTVVYETLEINYRKKLMTTISQKQIMSAFRNDASMESFINRVVSDLGLQREAFEFNAEKEQLQKGIAKYEYIDGEDDYAGFYLKIKNIITNFKDYDNSLYLNKYLNPRPAKISDLIIIISEDYKNKTNVNYLSTLFNVDYAELKDSFYYIKEFNDKNIKCMIIDKRGICFKKVTDITTQITNPADLTWNIWVHFWRLFEVSSMYGAVAISVREKSENIPTVSIESGVYEGQQTVTINQGSATNVKYVLDSGEETSVTSTAQVTIAKPAKPGYVSTLKITYDGGEDIYRYRII